VLLGELYISPDDIKNISTAKKLVGARPYKVTLAGDLEDYNEGVLEFLLTDVVRPAMKLGAVFQRVHYRQNPLKPFPNQLCVFDLPSALPQHIIDGNRAYGGDNRRKWEQEWEAIDIPKLSGKDLATLLDWTERNYIYYDTEIVHLHTLTVKEACARLYYV
jgi:hypothetical protein